MCLGIPGRVLDLDESGGLPIGTVDFGGVRKQVCLAYVPQIRVGEYVIVHVGFAISQVDEAEAARTFAVLRALGDVLAAELQPDRVPEAELRSDPVPERVSEPGAALGGGGVR
ncbi:MAG TPA: HypC/HybG/HupF family hydrogenase formation chaperone [Mycobacteriales bacterium]|nr:HypC/HybG/HupF family hydrogenase formation chaperone [Mycobacteriales bacterium]